MQDQCGWPKILLLTWQIESLGYRPLNVVSFPLHLPRGSALGIYTKYYFLWKPSEPYTPAIRGGKNSTDLQNCVPNGRKMNYIRKYLYDKFDLEKCYLICCCCFPFPVNSSTFTTWKRHPEKWLQQKAFLAWQGWASPPFLEANHVASAYSVFFDISQIYNGIRIRFFCCLVCLCFWLEEEGGGRGKKIQGDKRRKRGNRMSIKVSG